MTIHTEHEDGSAMPGTEGTSDVTCHAPSESSEEELDLALDQAFISQSSTNSAQQGVQSMDAGESAQRINSSNNKEQNQDSFSLKKTKLKGILRLTKSRPRNSKSVSFADQQPTKQEIQDEECAKYTDLFKNDVSAEASFAEVENSDNQGSDRDIFSDEDSDYDPFDENLGSVKSEITSTTANTPSQMNYFSNNIGTAHNEEKRSHPDPGRSFLAEAVKVATKSRERTISAEKEEILSRKKCLIPFNGSGMYMSDDDDDGDSDEDNNDDGNDSDDQRVKKRRKR